ncbi:tetratricopeptide repeat protein [Streptomyces rhizosphaerihabitans]|uniref:tetratricopeptide repeat protein n=1 Tax=Streptomyces rhizosphaerihabitans TaxID=1266770 RepID=UPI0021BF31A1|nr:tetratricopeptide repeat protein [Streptomyces rhizosphaerihabitans]MCT9007097.1 tetratricopeptide repeat protein [Streptomyces rhizosphaerihabitans]
MLADRERLFSPGHPGTLATRDHLARWQGNTGDTAGALVAYEELLTDALRVLGPDHPNTFTIRRALAWWQAKAGKDAVR